MKKRALIGLLIFPQAIAVEFSATQTHIDHVRGLRVRTLRAAFCEQIDGRASFCPGGRVRYFVSHWDQSHVPRFPPRNVDCVDGAKPPALFAAWRKIPACDTAAAEARVLVPGVLDWDGNRASRVFFVPRARIMVLADLPARELARNERSLRVVRANWILLPRSGSIGRAEAAALRALAPRYGFIATGMTPRKFEARGKIILRTTDWGNLVFAE